MKRTLMALVYLCLLFNGQATFAQGPAYLCTPDDPDFEAYHYREHIPRCKRNVSESDKREVAARWGIPASEYKKYHYDHIVSLCVGGSNALSNLQPRLPEKKLEKDKVEWATCRAMDRGEMTQAEAVARLRSLRVDHPNQ